MGPINTGAMEVGWTANNGKCLSSAPTFGDPVAAGREGHKDSADHLIRAVFVAVYKLRDIQTPFLPHEDCYVTKKDC